MSDRLFSSTCSSEFEQKVADLKEQVDYRKQVLVDLGGLNITPKDVRLVSSQPYNIARYMI
jgi:hypothetical protein